jgi:hypothetical protein
MAGKSAKEKAIGKCCCRFTLRLMLGIVILIAIAFVALTNRIGRYCRLAKCSSSIENLGAGTSWVKIGDFLDLENRAHLLYPLETADGRELVSNMMSPRYLHVELCDPEIKDSLARIRDLDEFVMSISCVECELKPETVKDLSHLRYLSLEIGSSQQLAYCLNAVNTESLIWLEIRTTKIDRAWLQNLRLDQIQVLDLTISEEDKSDQLLDLVLASPKLRSLHFAGTSFKADDISRLSNLTKLSRLSISSNSLDGQENAILDKLQSKIPNAWITINNSPRGQKRKE